MEGTNGYDFGEKSVSMDSSHVLGHPIDCPPFSGVADRSFFDVVIHVDHPLRGLFMTLPFVGTCSSNVPHGPLSFPRSPHCRRISQTNFFFYTEI